MAEVWVQGSAGLALIRSDSISSVNLRGKGYETYVDVISEGETYAVARKTVDESVGADVEKVVQEAGPIRAEFLEMLHKMECADLDKHAVLVYGENGWENSNA